MDPVLAPLAPLADHTTDFFSAAGPASAGGADWDATETVWRSDGDDGADDLDYDSHWAATYRPLSNLPTPPPSSQSTATLPCLPADQGTWPWLGPAIHLANLIPPAASLTAPSVPRVQSMLARAGLPLDTVALAVCILDALDSRFARLWRVSCPLGPKGHSGSGRSSSDAAAYPRIDAVPPEIIILAALVIAAKFTDDGQVGQQPTQAYCTMWGCSAAADNFGPASPWSGAQLAATERCIMQSLRYRILPLLDAGLLADARADMRRAGVYAARQQQKWQRETEDGHVSWP